MDDVVALGKPDAPENNNDDGSGDGGDPIDPEPTRHLPAPVVAKVEEGGAEEGLVCPLEKRSA
jgi:hypothetical protein